MKFNKLYLLVLLFGLLLSVTGVNAVDNITYDMKASPSEYVLASDAPNSYYVDCNNGDDSNNGQSWNSSLKSFNKALDLSHDNDNIYLSNGVYSDLENTKITINKSVNVIGSANTTFDGSYSNYIFIISDNNNITFKNINFANAYKIQRDYDLIENYDLEGVYGSALDIKNSKVTLDNCSFTYNMANYEANVYEFIYGGAISNFGDLTILNSYFYGNAIGATLDILGYGGSIYNKGKLFLNNSKFIDSRGDAYSNGGAIYNDGDMIINNSIIAYSHCWEESKGSAIFNNANLTLLNSIIENNTIERTDFNFIYGNIFNSGKLIAIGNIFRNNTAIYRQPNSEYYGTPTIYNIGELDLSYNAFIDNVGFDGIYRDVFSNSVKSVKIDNNWWQTNENPFLNNLVNYKNIDSWVLLDLTPTYSSIDINDSLEIVASWKLSNGENLQFNLPIFNLTFSTYIHGNEITSEHVFKDNVTFLFNFTENKGSYEVKAFVNSVSTTAKIDVGKLNTSVIISLNASEIYFNETVLVDVFLTDEYYNNLTDRVNLNLNNKIHVINIKNGHGNITLNDLTPGNYTLSVNYMGNDLYARSNDETSFVVKKVPVNLKITPIADIKTNESVELTVNLEGHKAEGMAQLYVNGIYKQPIYLNNGRTTFNLNYFSKGQYNLTVIFPENEYYLSAYDSIIFNVDITQVSINVSAKDIYAGESEIITIEVSSNGFNSNATLSINGINYTVFIKDKINRVTISDLTNGTYDVLVIFEGNDRFVKANASTSFKVSKQLSSLNVSIEKNNLTGSIIVKTNSNKCSGTIGLYVNQRYYSGNLKNGIASFDVKFDKGTNYIFVFYNGDFSFEPSSWNATIGNAEKFFLIADDITFYEHNDFNYTVSLYEENGFAMPNQVVSIEFEGKTYNLRTNNKGMVNLGLNLGEGVYSIIAKYENVTVNNTITIKAIVFDVNINNITYGENGNITVEFEGNITGCVNFEFLTKTIVANITNSKATCNLQGFSAGTYYVDIFYSNEFFNSPKVARSFTIYKANTEFDVEFNNMEIGKTGNIVVSFSDKVTGNVEFVIDNNRYLKEIIDSKAILNISELSGGYHNLIITYPGDNNYNNISLKTVFPVKILKTSIQIIVSNETSYGDELDISAILDDNATGNVIFNIGGLSKTCEVNNGVANWKVSGIDSGIHNLVASYESNDLFINQKNETSFKISKANSIMDIFVKEVYLDENIRIYAKLNPNATGKVSFSMDNYYSPRDKIVSNSSASWLISPLETGQYTVHANYSGDNNYYASSSTFILNISQKRSILTVEANDASNRDNVIFKVTLLTNYNEGISGVVNIKLLGSSYKVNVRNGKGTLNLGKLAPNEYKFTAYFEGNEKYSDSSFESSFTVSDYLLASVLSCNDVVKYYNADAKFVIVLTSIKGKAIPGETVYVTVKGVENTYVTDEDGKIYLNIGNAFEKYNVTAEFRGSDSYYPSNTTGSVEILSTIESSDLIKLYGTGSQYFAIFKDLSGKALMNTQVFFKILGKTYNYSTLPNGVIRLDIDIDPGTYSITAINPVTGENKTNKITVFNKLMGNKDVTNYFGAKSTYKVRAYDENGKVVSAGKLVIFKVNGKTYRIKTDKKGYATLSVKLNPKQYVVIAQFNGTKVSNKITVKPVLTTKITSNKKTKKTKFSAKLLNSKGKILKGKKITFKIKGKKYTAKTNKKGWASINIKLKLKKGTYKVYTTYGKSKVINIIRVK